MDRLFWGICAVLQTVAGVLWFKSGDTGTAFLCLLLVLLNLGLALTTTNKTN